MNEKSAIEYITNVSWRDSRLGLERMAALLALLDNPQDKLKFIHVAGTNGKGSTCVMLATVLRAAGYTTGLYTSPFISRFHERIQVDGQAISDEALVQTTEQVREMADTLSDHPTEFELITAIAFVYFLHCCCDLVVLEVGMGGRLDATNVIAPPEVAVITPLSLDHMQQLGDTVAQIAAEKGGIIKSGSQVVSAPQPSEAAAVLQDICQVKQVPLTVVDTTGVRRVSNTLAGQVFDFGGLSQARIGLLGAYQTENAAVVITVLGKLQKLGWSISPSAMRDGLQETRWPARFELLHNHPYVVVDGGHNRQCVEAIRENLDYYFPRSPVTLLTGVMADKDYQGMYEPLVPVAKRVFTVRPDNPRALPAEDLAAYFAAKGVSMVKAFDSVTAGLEAALGLAEESEVICACGSFFMAGAIRDYFNK